jgi:hypothetical protein
VEKYRLPYVVYNQGSIVHLECTGAMSFDFSSMNVVKSLIGLLKNKKYMLERKESMEKMGAAYMANGIVTLAGSRLYTSLADTDEVIDDALNRFENVFKHVVRIDKGVNMKKFAAAEKKKQIKTEESVSEENEQKAEAQPAQDQTKAEQPVKTEQKEGEEQ